MSKQSANQSYKKGQSKGKPSNWSTNGKGQTQVTPKPVQPAAKANATVTAKPVQSDVSSANKPLPKQASRQQRKQQKTQSRLEQQRIDARNRRITIFSFVAAFVLVASLITFVVIRNNASTNGLAQAETVIDPNHQPIDGVYCDSLEQLAYHIHAHLTIYINGANVPLSQGIGIDPGTTPSCYYWLHTHDTSGVIHIESPTVKTYSLKQFFDIWESFESASISYPTQLSSSTGWTIYVNGQKVNTDFSHLQLTAHELITIMYNSPGEKPDTVYSWGQL